MDELQAEYDGLLDEKVRWVWGGGGLRWKNGREREDPPPVGKHKIGAVALVELVWFGISVGLFCESISCG